MRPVVPVRPRIQVRDLSVPLDASTQVYPGDPVPEIEQATTVAGEGYNVLHVRMGSQTGTHVDAPYHVRDDGARIDELPLTRFVAPLVLADVRGLTPGAAISWEQLSGVAELLVPGVALVLWTGWSSRRGSAGYFDHPWLSPEATRQVLGRGVRTIGLDAPSLDRTLGQPARPELPSHQLVAAADGVIVENLTALETVDLPEPWLSVLPLRLTGADGAPCRAVALSL